MNRPYFLVLLVSITFFCQCRSGFHRYDEQFEHGSDVKVVRCDAQLINNLNVVGKVWGLMKYYHPAVRQGLYNWDFELLKFLPRVLYCSPAQRDSLLVKWMDRNGAVTSFAQIHNVADEFRTLPHLSWMDSLPIHPTPRARLKLLTRQHLGRQSFYVQIGEIPRPEFGRESPYSQFTYPDVGYRILSIFRYWNANNYYYPYRYLLNNWDDELADNLKRFISAKDETEYEMAILALITAIDDTHASLTGANMLQQQEGDYYAPAEVKFVEGHAVVCGYYDQLQPDISQLRRGDIIIRIAGKKVDDIITEKEKVTPASNFSTKLREIARNLLRTHDTILPVVASRNGSRLQLLVKCKRLYDENINYKYHSDDTCCKILPENIGYINPFYLSPAYIPRVMDLLSGTQALILDLRYPPGEDITLLGDYLLNKEVYFAKLTCPGNDYPGAYRYFISTKIGSDKSVKKYTGKVIILNSEETQSAAEFNTMAFRKCPNAVVIGSITAGADGDVTEISLPGGITTTFSGLGVYYPDGGETQQAGIVPDINFRPTLDGATSGKDELLEFAIRHVLTGQR